MTKPPKSGSARFMDGVIAVTAVLAAVCFGLFYSGRCPSESLLWTGVTAFTIFYHLWVRLLVGGLTKRLPIDYRQRWFRERAFEKSLYQVLRVRKWKDKALTYDPDAFSLRKNSLEEVANAMAKAEADHWLNQLISLSTLLFAIPWGELWIFLLTALCAMVFDAQFILIQRYNRPRVVRLLEKKKGVASCC